MNTYIARHSFIFYLFLIVVIGTFLSCNDVGDNYYPTQNWKKSKLDDQKLNKAYFDSLTVFITDSLPLLSSILVIKNGYIVYEKYGRNFDENSYHELHSATKSFTSAFVGIALKQGLIESVNDKISKYLNDFFQEKTDSLISNITIEHL